MLTSKNKTSTLIEFEGYIFKGNYLRHSKHVSGRKTVNIEDFPRQLFASNLVGGEIESDAHAIALFYRYGVSCWSVRSFSIYFACKINGAFSTVLEYTLIQITQNHS